MISRIVSWVLGEDSTSAPKVTVVNSDWSSFREVDIASPLPSGNNVIGRVALTGNTLVEQKTEDDEETETIIFNSNIETLEIYNMDETTGTFLVNGFSIVVPPGKVFKASIGGSLDNTVKINGTTKYIISRYV